MILAIETSTEMGSIAYGDEAQLITEINFQGDKQKRHSALLFPALAKLDIPHLELDRIVVGLGPGSFVGIRVALAAAQAIALIKKIPVHGICSAFSVAAQLKRVTRLGVFADARRGEYYETIFQNGVLEKETFLLNPEQFENEIGKVTLAVSAEPLEKIPERSFPRARDFLSLPQHSSAWAHGELEPVYLRNGEAIYSNKK